MKNDYLTVGEVSDYLKLPEETVYKYARTSRMPASKVGRYWRFNRSEIDLWVGKHSNASKPMMSVLVVDDEPAIRNLLQTWLVEMNCSPFIVSSGEEAVSALDHQSFDLILLDLMMPDMNGVEVLRRITQEHQKSEVIIVTAYFESRLMDQAMLLGPITVLKKPVFKDALAHLVQSQVAKLSA